MLRHCASNVKRHDLENAYFGGFVGAHPFVFMCEAPVLVFGHDKFEWHVGCGHLKDSAAIG